MNDRNLSEQTPLAEPVGPESVGHRLRGGFPANSGATLLLETLAVESVRGRDGRGGERLPALPGVGSVESEDGQA